MDDKCPYMDFVTGEPCVRDKGHEPYHQMEDGTQFGIGYTKEEAEEWRNQNRE